MPIIGEWLRRGIIGPKIFWYDIGNEERLCREYDVNKNELTGNLTVKSKEGIKKEYSLNREVLNIKYGTFNKASLAKIKSQKHNVKMPNGTFKTLSWDKMSDEQRASVLNRTMTHNAEIAKIYIWTQEMGHKYYASDSVYAELKKLGITRGVYRGDKGFAE